MNQQHKNQLKNIAQQITIGAIFGLILAGAWIIEPQTQWEPIPGQPPIKTTITQTTQK